MVLNNKDLNKIGESGGVKISEEFDSFKLEMHQRFDQTSQIIDKAETEIKDSLDEIKQIILRRRAWYKSINKEEKCL